MSSEGIAIIGMTGRFPGAPSVDRFWERLRDGENCISFFSDEELLAEGVPAGALADPLYVKARGILDDVAGFDAKFFGFSPREADITDPQQRLFLECCWEALEDAAYAPSAFPGRIGVFGGSSWSTYFFDLYGRPDIWRALGAFQIAIGNEKDHLTTRVSYKLNLRGPAVTVQTACSSSLVAVALACQNLTAGQCDLALAGGVSLSIPQKSGYLYQEGGILCPDGHCRAFDAEAQGTIGGNGAGVVVLRRLGDAIAAGDRIRAVIRGWGVNNDGSGKVGYTAPSITGQADAIAAAHERAGVTPDSISYVEAHGTGTPLGDPIEVAALIDAFRRGTDGVGYCALGSVKTNIGHLDAAAGVAGLIKTTLALEHATLPPSLHFRTPNPAIPFATSPFFVNAERREWTRNGAPRRAGVSSFGIGGTNAHVVIEEAPAIEPSGPSRAEQLLVLSANTATALETMTANLGAHLDSHRDANLADVAYTLQSGRTELPHRRVIVCRNVDEAIAECTRTNAALTGVRKAHPPRVALMFPGQGSQHAGMMAGLYESEPVYRAHVDALLATLDADPGDRLRTILTTREEVSADDTIVAQPALFIAEYALAQLLIEWGIVPDAVLGHSVGELTAACVAGVFTPADALQLVVVRGRLMQELPRGKMLAVPLAEEQVRAVAGASLSVAAVNGPEMCVVSGPGDDVDALARELRRRGVAARELRTSHAFHSAAMDPIIAPFEELVASVPRSAPRLPIVSNVTGTWLDAATATDPRYWSRHIRETVRFADGLRTVLQAEGRILLEAGPGQVLTTFAGRHPSRTAEHLVIAAGKHQQDPQSDARALLTAVGRVWIAGAPVNWSALAKHERRRRVGLPSYPFERQRHWVDPVREEETFAAAPSRPREIADWLYAPSWTRKAAMPHGANGAAKSWLLFADDEGCADAVAARLANEGHTVTLAKAAKKFARTSDDRYTLAPHDAAGYTLLLEELQRAGRFPDAIAHFWGVTRTRPAFARAQERGFYSLLHLARALRGTTQMPLSVVATNLFDVRGDESVHPEKATILGPCKVIPQERSQLRFRVIDLASPAAPAARVRTMIDDSGAAVVLDALPDLATESETSPDCDGEPEDLAYVLYTSGSTGTPKGVEITHRAIVNHAVAIGRAFGLRKSDRVLQLASPAFDVAGEEIFPALLRGAAIVPAMPDASRAADVLLAQLERDRVTVMNLPTPLWQAWMPELHRLPTCLRLLVVGSDRAADDTLARWREQRHSIRLLHGYGVTEATITSLLAEIGDDDTTLPIGRPIANTEAFVFDAHGQPVPVGVQGELYLGGAGLARGYRGRPDLTNERFIAHPFRDDRLYRTGDAVRWRNDGRIEFVGRLDDQLKIHGFRIEPAEIEAALLRHPAVTEARVIRREDTPGDPRLVAYVVSTTAVASDALAHFLREQLPEAMVPAAYVTMRELPRTPGGKVDRAALPPPGVERPALQTRFAPPQDELERAIVRVWREVLQLDDAGCDDNFFDLGGRSLLLVRVHSHLRHVLGDRVTMLDLFRYPTIRALAAHIRRGTAREQSA